jgi:eukaryotic-like serine/threonine-protein kinase
MPSITDSIGRVLGDRYRLVTALGTGASAHVYLADDVSLHRQVAIKVLHPALAGDASFLKRFRAEARAVAALNHPNVLQVYDWGEEHGEPYLVLEYLSGGSLRQIYDTGALLTTAQAVHVGIDAAAGLDYAHRRGLVHRDIKPANLLFDGERRLRIADFGLARALAEAAWTEPDGALLGTARYAAPEQVEGWTLDGKADVYALALVLYEGVTGQAPFVGDTIAATLMSRVGTLLPEHDALGPLNDVLVWAAAPEPDERLDAITFSQRLQALAVALPAPGPLPLITADPDESEDAAPMVGIRSAARGSSPAVVGEATELGVVGVSVGGPAGTAPTESTMVTSPNGGANDADGNPRPRRRWPWIVTAVVLAAALVAAGGVYAVRHKVFTPSHDVPSLVGMTMPEAGALASKDHFALRSGSGQFSIGVAPGLILGQQPGPGGGGHPTTAKEGSTVTVVVSEGPPPVAIPGLAVFSTCNDAINALSVVHLVGVCPAASEQYSSTVAAGGVLGSNPTGTAPYGSTVTIVVSKGHAPVTIPNVSGSGSTSDTASAALKAAGLVSNVISEYNSSIPTGQVIGTTPDPSGGPVPYGSTVTIAVSLGPQPVTVPDLRDDSTKAAAAALQAVGLTLGNVYGPTDGRVFDSNPSTGASVPPGTSVDVYTK